MFGRYLLAALLVIGFFGTVLSLILGFVDISNTTVASLMGTVVGYIAGMIQRILEFYFGRGKESYAESKKSSDRVG